MSSARAAKIRDSHFCRAGYRTQIALASPRRPKARSHFPALQTLPLRPGSARPALHCRHLAAPNTHPFPNSSLPPSRGEVRWGVGVPSRRHRPRPAPITHAIPPPSPPLPSVIPARPSVTPTPPSVIPAPAPSFLRRQEPTRRSPPALAPNIRRRGSSLASRQDVAARANTGGRLDSCLRRNDGGSAGVTGLRRNDGSLNSP